MPGTMRTFFIDSSRTCMPGENVITSIVGQGIDALDTPALLVDADALAANVALMATTLRQRGTEWRPHAKAHKSPAVAHLLLEAGAHGITCAKASEAEVYAAAGVNDILVANQVVGPIKTRRVAHLARYADVAVAVDSFENVLEHEAAASAAGTSPRLLVEIDCGMNRAGVPPGENAVRLAERIAALKHVRFGGVMTWEGHTLGIADPAEREAAVRAALVPVLETVEAIRATGIDVPIVSCGGTGTFLATAGIPGVTEIQAGGGIFGDRFYRDLDVPVQPALGMLVTVTSRPTPTRIIIDAGRKSIDPTAMPPELCDVDHVASMAFSAEHGTIELCRADDEIRVGDRLRLNIGYSDQAVHLHEQMFVIRGEEIDSVWPTAARGRLQ